MTTAIPRAKSAQHIRDDALGLFFLPAVPRAIRCIELRSILDRTPDRPDGFLRATMDITSRAADVEEAFRWMLFKILALNRDDHTRQHSYLQDADGEWRLAPAYDLTFSYVPGGEHYLAVDGEGRAPTRSQVTVLGRRHGLTERAIIQIVEQVRASLEEWPGIAEETGVTVSKAEIRDRYHQVTQKFA